MAGSVSSVAIVGGMFQYRAEHDVRHALAEDWRLVARLADHRADVEHDAVPLVRLEVEVRNVDAEVARAKVVGQIPPAFQVHRHLTDARVERDVEGRARLLVHAAGRRQPVVLLEDADGRSQGLVEARALDRCRTEVAGGCEPLSERGHRRTRGAGPQARGRHTRPSALRFGAAQRGETPAERRVLVVRRLDGLEPLADVVSRRGEARRRDRAARAALSSGDPRTAGTFARSRHHAPASSAPWSSARRRPPDSDRGHPSSGATTARDPTPARRPDRRRGSARDRPPRPARQEPRLPACPGSTRSSCPCRRRSRERPGAHRHRQPDGLACRRTAEPGSRERAAARVGIPHSPRV